MNFMKYKWLYFLISAFIIIPGIYSLVKYGLALSVDFTGGTVLELKFKQLAISNQQLAINQCMWFDKNGIIFEEAPFVEGNLINNVDDLSGRSLNLGDLVLEEKFYSNLFKIFDVLEKSDLGIKSLKLERIELQEILTESSPKIYFSLRVDPGFTLAAIDSMKNIGLEKIEYIDLRVENRAYYKLK